MFLRRDVNEARSGRGRGQTCIIFFNQILHFNLIFSKKNEIFDRFSTGLQTFRLKTDFNMGTLLVNTPKTTSYAFGRRLLLLCLHTE